MSDRGESIPQTRSVPALPEAQDPQGLDKPEGSAAKFPAVLDRIGASRRDLAEAQFRHRSRIRLGVLAAVLVFVSVLAAPAAMYLDDTKLSVGLTAGAVLCGIVGLILSLIWLIQCIACRNELRAAQQRAVLYQASLPPLLPAPRSDRGAELDGPNRGKVETPVKVPYQATTADTENHPFGTTATDPLAWPGQEAAVRAIPGPDNPRKARLLAALDRLSGAREVRAKYRREIRRLWRDTVGLVCVLSAICVGAAALTVVMRASGIFLVGLIAALVLLVVNRRGDARSARSRWLLRIGKCVANSANCSPISPT